MPAGELGYFKGGSGFPVKFQGLGSGDLPFFKVSDMNKPGNELYMRTANNYVSEAQRKSMGAVRIPAGAIVFAKVGAAVFLERKRILAQDSCIDNNMAAFVVDRARVDIRFAHYLLCDFRMSSLVATTALPSLNGTQLRAIPLRLPSAIDVQLQIVEALADADDLVASLERLIAKKRAIKQGMMQELLTGKTRLGAFAEPWKTVRLGDCVKYVKTTALSRAQLDDTSSVRYLHYGDIHANASAFLDAARQIMPRARRELIGSAARLEVGDVVFADASEDAAGVGKSVEIASVPSAGLIAGMHTIAARFDKSVLADGFKGYLQFVPNFRNTLLRFAAGTKVLATAGSYISGVELRLPSTVEQQFIANALHDADAEIEALERRLKTTRNIKQGMMQELLTGRTRLIEKEVAA
ncbi:hypothetical protein GCM10027052_10500 [Parafrigoribacterium mesophilum]